MKKTIYVVRHGQTEYNKKGLVQGRRIDAPLDETGKKQALELAQWFSDKHLDAIHCSSLQRTYQTALPTANMHGLSISAHKELDEMDYGDLEGSTTLNPNADFYRLRSVWEKGDISHPAPNGESPFDVLNRAQSKCTEIIQNSGKDAILFMIHGRLIRILIAHWLGLGLEKMHLITHSNAGINVLSCSDNLFQAELLNYTQHLSTSDIHA